MIDASPLGPPSRRRRPAASAMGRGSSRSGFSLVEMLIAMGLVLAVLAALLTAVVAAQRLATVQPELIDMQQRLRVGIGAVAGELEMAGAGGQSGCAASPLHHVTAPIRPYRAGLRSASPPGSFSTAALTIVFVPASAPVATTSVTIASESAVVPIAAGRGSGLSGQAFGFTAGMSVGVIADDARLEAFQVAGVGPGELSLVHMGQGLARPIAAGACVTEIRWTVFEFDAGGATGAGRLTTYDGYRSEQPLVDQVVTFRLGYLGEADPPVMLRDAADPDGPWTTYGPRPPPPADDDPLDAWGPGDNCAFVSTGVAHLPRLDWLGASGTLVPLPPARLSDGPWCPDPLAPNRFDADLLRIRRIVVTLGIRAVDEVLRGPAGILFTRGGLAQSPDTMAPDVEATIDITPPNLSAAR